MFSLFLLLDILFPFEPEINYSQTVLSKEGEILGAFLSKDDIWRFKSELHEISPVLIKLVILKEDKYFYYHNGVNVISIVRAFISNFFSGGRQYGGSTITMQLARMLEPKKRTYFNKLIESFRALQLEFHYSKNEILEMYLNHLPFGGNIEGCNTASVLYLGTRPDKLSLSQSAALLVIPQNPNKYVPGKANEIIKIQRDRILKLILNRKIFSNEEISYAMAENFSAYRREIPKIAPHLAYRMSRKYKNTTVIKTNINFWFQSAIAGLVQNHMINQYDKSIKNASVIVVENKTGNVIAYIGSNDFYDKLNAGQVDGITAVRSPGSALKPLVYALGFDKGLVTPKSRLLDVPFVNADYSPENYSGTFKGEVTVETALIKSLNVPAVRLLKDVGLEIFVNTLIKSGFKKIEQQRKKMGLSVVLGGCGVTLEELTKFYSAFANAGKIKPLNYVTKSDYDTNTTTIISPEAAFMISEILSKSPRQDVLTGYLSGNIPVIAWKTGTSYGRRDAWSIGYNKEYTVGVWAGNFSGEPSSELAGSTVSTPLLFDIFRYICKDRCSWFDKPDDLAIRQVDEETGLLPGKFTVNTVNDYYIPLVSNNKISENYTEIPVSIDEKYSYCEYCLPEGNYIMKTFPVIHPDLLAYYEKFEIPYKKVPEHNPQCKKISEGNAPVIASPLNGREYFIEKNNPVKIMLKCYVSNDIHRVFWYINDKFYSKNTNDETIFFLPEKAGKYKISCSDELGRSSNLKITVKYY